MSVSKEYADFIYERLEPLGHIVMRRMFGAMGIYCGQLFFAIVSDNVLYLKVDEENIGDFQEAGMEPFRPYGDDGPPMKYYEVPANVIENDDLLLHWAGKAVNVARRAPIKKKPPRRRTK